MKKTIYTLACETTNKYDELAFASHADVIQFFQNQEADLVEVAIRGEYFIVTYKTGKIEVGELVRRILVDY